MAGTSTRDGGGAFGFGEGSFVGGAGQAAAALTTAPEDGTESPITGEAVGTAFDGGAGLGGGPLNILAMFAFVVSRLLTTGVIAWQGTTWDAGGLSGGITQRPHIWVLRESAANEDCLGYKSRHPQT